jgi:activator of 2-hydroxyglutaryl-CoA dehydratase
MSEAMRKSSTGTRDANHAGARYVLGIDLGSVSLKTVVLSERGEILEDRYTRTKGLPMETSLAVLKDLFGRYPADAFKALGVTGSGGKILAGLLGG